MANIDNSLNRVKLISVFLKQNNLSNLIKVNEFDEHFYFEDPIRLDVFPTNRNTKISIIAKADSEYFGKKSARYNRIHISELPNIEVYKNGELSLYSLLQKINEKYDLYLTDSDVDDIDISGVLDGPYSPTLIIKNTSLIFYSGTIIVTTP